MGAAGALPGRDPGRTAPPGPPARPAPALGADTDDILRSLGYGAARLKALTLPGN